MTVDIIGGHELRISRLEVQMADVRIELANLSGKIAELTRILAEVRDNTGEMVTISKSLKLLGRIATWGGAISTFAAAFYAARFLPMP